MENEYINVVDTVDRLKYLCDKLNLSKLIDGDYEQIDILSEIKERIESIELEKVSDIPENYYKYQA